MRDSPSRNLLTPAAWTREDHLTFNTSLIRHLGQFKVTSTPASSLNSLVSFNLYDPQRRHFTSKDLNGLSVGVRGGSSSALGMKYRAMFIRGVWQRGRDICGVGLDLVVVPAAFRFFIWPAVRRRLTKVENKKASGFEARCLDAVSEHPLNDY
jgi:hypothetical protein